MLAPVSAVKVAPNLCMLDIPILLSTLSAERIMTMQALSSGI
jgi:hypothetical protein